MRGILYEEGQKKLWAGKKQNLRKIIVIIECVCYNEKVN